MTDPNAPPEKSIMQKKAESLGFDNQLDWMMQSCPGKEFVFYHTGFDRLITYKYCPAKDGKKVWEFDLGYRTIPKSPWNPPWSRLVFLSELEGITS